MRTTRRAAVAAVALSSLLSVLVGCDDTGVATADATREKLVGAWVREVNEPDGAKGRSTLQLGDDGRFTEVVELAYADGRTSRKLRAGEWTYDGTNFKRRYTHEDGGQLSGNFHFSTFALGSVSAREFTGRNLQGAEIVYRRTHP